MRAVPYRRAVGLLQYLANTSRPDIAHSVSQVARYSEDPGSVHWQAVKRIMRYLVGTSDRGLLFHAVHAQRSHAQPASGVLSRADQVGRDALTLPSIPICCYADADFAGCIDTGRSTTGWLLLLGGSIVDWGSKMQATTALSTCEAEYMSMTPGTQGILWARQLIDELDARVHPRTDGRVIPDSSSTPPAILTLRDRPESAEVKDALAATDQLRNDNQSAVQLATNPAMRRRSKHINVRCHFTRERVADGSLRVMWCSTHEQLADILTKPLGPYLFNAIRDQIVHSRKALMERA